MIIGYWPTRRNASVRSRPSEPDWPLNEPAVAPDAIAARSAGDALRVPTSCATEWIDGQRAITPSSMSRSPTMPCTPRSMAANLSRKYCRGIVA